MSFCAFLRLAVFNSSEFPTVALYAGASFTVGLLMAYAGHWCMKV